MKKYFSFFSSVTVSLVALTMFFSMPLRVFAASTDQADEPFESEKKCSLTVAYNAADAEFENTKIQLYRVADFTADYDFVLTEDFAECGLDVNHLDSSDQWATVADTLDSYVKAHSPAAAGEYTVGVSNTTAAFDNLPSGWYFIPQVVLVCENDVRTFSSVMATLPTVEEGKWVYSVATKPKSEIAVPTYKDVTYFINVVWDDKGFEQYRPDSIVAHITHSTPSQSEGNSVAKTSVQRSMSAMPKALAYGNVGVSSMISLLSETDEIPAASVAQQDVTINPAMNWHYEWTAKDDGTVWNVIGSEAEHYTMTVKTTEHGWTLEYHIDAPPSPVPKTGEDFPWLPIVLLLVSGTALVIFGIVSRRKHHDR